LTAMCAAGLMPRYSHSIFPAALTLRHKPRG
jgi:hypothetical protein